MRNLNPIYEYYEKMPKAKYFWSQGGDFPQYQGKEFLIIRRQDYPREGIDIGWVIKFPDGFETIAFEDEIFLPEMKDNGYRGE